LVDECLAAVDPRLFSHLKRHGAVAKIYAFPAAMTLSASVGPLHQVVRLWDFLLAFGVHLNVVCIVAQLVAMRELLLTTRSPMALLRSWPPLRADAVIRRTREIYDLLPERLRRYIKHHAHDPHLAERLASAPQVADPLAEPAVCTLPSSPFSPLGPRSPALQQQPQSLQKQPQSLKRDLPLSPDAGAATTPPAVCCSSPASRSSSTASRPRARTFSGMVKRPRTDGRPLPDVLPVGLPVSTLARSPPPYGNIGLGICPPTAYSDPQQQQQRASSSSSIVRKTRPLRMSAAPPDARWLPDRKVSTEHRDAHH
ncbi:CDC16 protein, partial [Coemansia spiralis]